MDYRTVYSAVILIVMLPFAAIAEPQQLAANIESFAVLSSTEVLYASSDWEFFIADPQSGKTRPWSSSWSFADEGWDGAGAVVQIEASPDGQSIMYARHVWLDGELNPSPGAPFLLRSAVAVIVCRLDGSEARCVGLGIEVGGGPQFDFTMDSQGLFGQPFLPCEPTVRAFMEFAANDWPDTEQHRFNYLDVASGERRWLEGLDMSDGYNKCPYSDNLATTDWWATVWFSSVADNEQTGMMELPEEDNGLFIESWVLQDAVLAGWQDAFALIYTDGRIIRDESETLWRVYCWLPDGTCLFSDDGGETAKYGKVDWSSFTVDWWVDRTDLLPHLWGQGVALPDSSGVIFRSWDSGALYYAPVTREGARP